MHDLFTQVLGNRDLSRAGDMFSVADSSIVNDLTEVINRITEIASQPDYCQNDNDQSVVEICVTRVTSCIRETGSVEKHCTALVALLESCLHHNLQPQHKDEDPPHAKIAADVISCIFLASDNQNYSKKAVMEATLPVAVKFLHKGNKELSRNMARYLSLAAIHHSSLLQPHVQQIMDSIISGNYPLCRVLSQLYEVSPGPLNGHAMALVSLLPHTDQQEKLALLSLFELMAKNEPSVLEASISQLLAYLCPITANNNSSSCVCVGVLKVLLCISQRKPSLLVEYLATLYRASLPPHATPNHVILIAQILAQVGKLNKPSLCELLGAAFGSSRSLLNVCHINAQSIPAHYDDLLASFSSVPMHALLIGETWLKSSLPSALYSLPGYRLIRCDRVGRTGGGVAMYLREDLSHKVIYRTQSGSQLECLFVEERAQEALNFVLDQLAGSERSCHAALLKEATALCSAYPSLFTDKLLHGVRHRNNNNIQTASNQVNQTSGGVTIVKLGGPNPTVSVPLHTAPPSNVPPPSSPPPVPPVGYTRRAKLGDSRSTGRLHTSSNTHRSMTRLNVAGSSVGGLHKSMTRLSSSQQINNQSSVPTSIANGATTSTSGSTITSSSTQQSKGWTNNNNMVGMTSKGISSGGVTVTTISPSSRILRHPNARSHNIQHSGQIIIGQSSTGTSISSGPTHLGNSSQIQSISINPLTITKSSDSISLSPLHVVTPSPSVSIQHSNGALGQVSVLTSNSLTSNPNGSTGSSANPVSITGPVTVTSRRANNTSVTMINTNASQRISVFEPYPMRDTVQHFCEKHLDKIKAYMDKVSLKIPPPAKCTIEERRAKKLAKLHFACQARGQHCLYSRTFFTMRTRNPRIWIHLMFIALQARSSSALSSRDSSVSCLKHCWDILKCENKSFVTLVTSAFPCSKDQETILNELRQAGFFDVFELNQTKEGEMAQWGCFLCNHPERAMGFLNGNTQPVIEGQLKEKKGRWRLFRRWRTRYFTLSGAHLSCKGSSGGESIDVNQIRSVKVSRGARNIPKAFEIFTGDQTLILKPKDGKNAEEWVQCLSIIVAHSQARDNPAKSNSLPARGITLKNLS